MRNRFTYIQLFACLVSLCLFAGQAHAVKWTKLKSTKNSTLMLDKASVALKDGLKKAWLKIEYNKPQANAGDTGKQYNLSKVLWYFKCDEQKSATSQVAQFLDAEMVYSAGIDVKKAEFIDPVPETDVDVAMRFVCHYDPEKEKADAAARIAKQKADAAAKKKKEEEAALAKKLAFEKAEKERLEKEAELEKKMAALAEEEGGGKNKHKKKSKKKKGKGGGEWSYEKETGPDEWGFLKYKYASCKIGKNQSPINIDKTIKAKLKRIKNIRKLPGKEIENTGQGIQINFDFGNMMVLDEAPYQMKHVAFHTPAEHSINGESFPLEAQFFHTDNEGNKTIVSVLFREGKPNKALAKIWLQLPRKKGQKKRLNKRVRAKELMPSNPSYYRYTGSLTTPPCTEGVKWVVFKTPLTASTAQIEQLERALPHLNNRPLQSQFGRVVLE